MPRSTLQHNGFLGGEWGPLAQGRADDPNYRQALSLCRNMVPVEEGALTRRSGTEIMAPTYLRGTAKLLGFQSSALTPYLMEFTDDSLQFYFGSGQVCTNDRRTVTASVDNGGSFTLTLDAVHGWNIGDHVVMWFPTTIAASISAPLRNRVFNVHATPTTAELTLMDDLDNTVPFHSSSNDYIGARVLRLLRFDTTGFVKSMLPFLRAVGAETLVNGLPVGNSIILGGNAVPHVVTVTVDQAGDTDPTITYQTVTFADGPYLDPQGTIDTPETGTVGGYSGVITFTSATTLFETSDIGRMIRLFSQPPAWNSGSTYTTGDFVTDGTGEWWVWTYSSGLAGIIPGTATTIGGVQVLPWAPAPTAGQWAWGTITAVASPGTTGCTVTLVTDLNSLNGGTIAVWRLGRYQAGNYPQTGLYHEGRLWLFTGSSFDASVSNDIFTYSPTDIYGNVLDTSAISYTLNFDDINTVYWAKPDHQGILCGTPGGDILIAASTLSDPLTPTSIQAKKVSKLGAGNADASRAGIALIFVQRYARRVMELLADAFTGLYSGPHINEYAKHLTEAGIVELAYQEETVPTVWTRQQDGSLAGCTYRRISRFTSEPPKYTAWHQQHIADDAVTTQGICTLPGIDGLGDRLYMVTEDTNGQFWVETMRPLFEDP